MKKPFIKSLIVVIAAFTLEGCVSCAICPSCYLCVGNVKNIEKSDSTQQVQSYHKEEEILAKKPTH